MLHAIDMLVALRPALKRLPTRFERAEVRGRGCVSFVPCMLFKGGELLEDTLAFVAPHWWSHSNTSPVLRVHWQSEVGDLQT